MKKVKRILAIAGILIIAALYIITLILALKGSESTARLFTASIAATVAVPVLIYIFMWLNNLSSKNNDKGDN